MLVNILKAILILMSGCCGYLNRENTVLLIYWIIVLLYWFFNLLSSLKNDNK